MIRRRIVERKRDISRRQQIRLAAVARGAALAWGLGLSLGSASAAPSLGSTPGGSKITNTATFMPINIAPVDASTSVVMSSICRLEVSAGPATEPVILGGVTNATFTVTNTGNAAFPTKLSISASPAGTTATLDQEEVQLAAGQSITVKATVKPISVGKVLAKLTASCSGSEASASQTFEALQPEELRVSKLIESTKSEDPTQADDPLGPRELVSGAQPRSLVRYSITVTNPNAVPVVAVVKDSLDNRLSMVSSQPATAEQQTSTSPASWLIPLEAGETKTIHVVAKLPDVDEASIDNVAIANVQGGEKNFSTQKATVTIWAPTIAVQKDVDMGSANIGSTLSYTITTTNTSQQAVLPEMHLRDELPAGLKVIQSSITLNGKPAEDTNPDPQVIEVSAGETKPGQTHVLRYRAVVSSSVIPGSDLTNIVKATGLRDGTPATATAVSSATIHVISHGLADIYGRVFVDKNGDGRYTPGTDLPAQGAKLLLATGQVASTDAKGNYHFNNLLPGQYGLTLDPKSVQHLALPAPSDLLRSGARLVVAYGLTPVNFLLLPGTGEAQGLRATTVSLEQGKQKAQLRKVVRPNAGGFMVEYQLSGTAGLRVGVNDPIPASATPCAELGAAASGELRFEVTIGSDGTAAATCQFNFAGPPEEMTTDPTIEVKK